MRSVLRILFTAAIAILILFLGATAVIRQPLLTHRKPTGHDPADARRLEAHVRFLTAHPNQPVVTDYIAQRFRESGGIVEVQEFSARRQTWRNVIAHFGPRDSTPPLVIGAHHDTLFSRPGADDNASGVAGLLELARLLGRHPPRTPVTLVAYANEEPPFFADGEGDRRRLRSGYFFLIASRGGSAARRASWLLVLLAVALRRFWIGRRV